MNSHNRIGIIEVMGNRCQDLAFFSAVSSGVDYTALPGEVLTPEKINKIYKKTLAKQKSSCLILVTEKTYPNIHEFALEVEKITKVTTRATSLGHIQRGGAPVPMDIYIATMMGSKAVEMLLKSKTSRCIGFVNNSFVDYDILDALKKTNINRTDFVTTINKINI